MNVGAQCIHITRSTYVVEGLAGAGWGLMTYPLAAMTVLLHWTSLHEQLMQALTLIAVSIVMYIYFAPAHIATQQKRAFYAITFFWLLSMYLMLAQGLLFLPAIVSMFLMRYLVTRRRAATTKIRPASASVCYWIGLATTTFASAVAVLITLSMVQTYRY